MPIGFVDVENFKLRSIPCPDLSLLPHMHRFQLLGWSVHVLFHMTTERVATNEGSFNLAHSGPMQNGRTKVPGYQNKEGLTNTDHGINVVSPSTLIGKQDNNMSLFGGLKGCRAIGNGCSAWEAGESGIELDKFDPVKECSTFSHLPITCGWCDDNTNWMWIVPVPRPGSAMGAVSC